MKKQMWWVACRFSLVLPVAIALWLWAEVVSPGKISRALVFRVQRFIYYGRV